MNQWQKTVKTIKEKYGEDHYKKIGAMSSKPTRGDSEAMRKVVQARWDKYRKLKKEEKWQEQNKED